LANLGRSSLGLSFCRFGDKEGKKMSSFAGLEKCGAAYAGEEESKPVVLVAENLVDAAASCGMVLSLVEACLIKKPCAEDACRAKYSLLSPLLTTVFFKFIPKFSRTSSGEAGLIKKPCSDDACRAKEILLSHLWMTVFKLLLQFKGTRDAVEAES
jgi:hypothetical protein